jgi:PTS system nitrogen regulatory IIA component
MALAVLESSEQDLNSIQLSDYIALDQIFELENVGKREDALSQMLEHLQERGIIEDMGSIRQALTEREQHVSTSLGKGLSLPHARLPSFKDFLVAVGFYPPGISWGSHDLAPVHLVFLVLGPDDKQLEYLRLVAQIADLAREDYARKILLNCRQPKEILRFFKSVLRR